MENLKESAESLALKEKLQVSIYLAPDIVAALREQAKSENRSASSEAATIIERALGKRA